MSCLCWIAADIHKLSFYLRRNAYGYVYCSPALLPHGFFAAWCLNLSLNVGWLFLWDRRCTPQRLFFQHIATGTVAQCGLITALLLQADGRCSGLPHLRCFDQLRDDLLLLPQPPPLRSVARQIPQSGPVPPPRAGQTGHLQLPFCAQTQSADGVCVCFPQVQNGIAIYATWTTVASLVNLSIVLVKDAKMSPEDAVTLSFSLLTGVLLVW